MHDVLTLLILAAAAVAFVPLYKRNQRIERENSEMMDKKQAELTAKWLATSYLISDKNPGNALANERLLDAAQMFLLPYHPSYTHIIITPGLILQRNQEGIRLLDDLTSRLNDNRWSDVTPANTALNSEKYNKLRNAWLAASVQVHAQLQHDEAAHTLLLNAAFFSVLPYGSSTKRFVVGAGTYSSRYDQGFAKLEELNKLLKPAQS